MPSTSGNFDHPNNAMFCGEVIMIKTFKRTKEEAFAVHVDFISLLAKSFLIQRNNCIESCSFTEEVPYHAGISY